MKHVTHHDVGGLQQISLIDLCLLLSSSSVPSLCPPPFLSCSLSVLCLGFPGDTVVKNLPANAEMQETWVGFLNWEDPLE